MNKIFRTVYNHSTNTWAAVSELAKGRVKSSSINSPLNLFSLSSTTVAIIAIATGIGVSSIAMGDTVIIKDGNSNTYSNGTTGAFITTLPGDSSTTNFQFTNSNTALNTITSYCSASGTGGTGNGFIACGSDARANLNQGTAYGSSAWAVGNQSVAVGGNTKALGASSVAIGGDDLDEASRTNLDGTLASSINGGEINQIFKGISGFDL